MFTKDILHSYVIFFKNNYGGTLPIYSRANEIPSDKSFILIKIGNSNNSFDEIDNRHQLLTQPIIINVNLYKNDDPYTPELEDVEALIHSINYFKMYDFSALPYIETNKIIRIDRTSNPLFNEDGDFESISYIVNIVNSIEGSNG